VGWEYKKRSIKKREERGSGDGRNAQNGLVTRVETHRGRSEKCASKGIESLGNVDLKIKKEQSRSTGQIGGGANDLGVRQHGEKEKNLLVVKREKEEEKLA